MTLSITRPDGPQPPEPAEPAWDVARLFPAQGTWSEQEYLDLKGNRLVEFSNGIVEVLTMPTAAHQLIALFLCDMLRAFVRPAGLGKVLIAAFRVRLWEGKFRQPDVMFMRAEHAARTSNEFWDGADLVMEVVSEDDRRRDVETKRFEYARAGIPEYWVVDPQYRRITVLRLEGQRYVVHGEFAEGARASSALLPGFEVGVTEAFAAGEAD
jgi:Uma2 family endonuclease